MSVELKENQRNFGIDLLRILSIFMITILHTLGQGEILKRVIPGSLQFKFVWLVEICAFCAVDIFALISGYVSYTDKEKKWNLSKYIRIWVEVVFYGLLITLIFNVAKPNIRSKKDYIVSIFPITNGLYWYFTAYTALFIAFPFLNIMIRNCGEKRLKKLFILIIIMFSLFDTFANRFVLNNGYSFIWIALLYILGAIIKKCKIGENLETHKIIIGIVSLYIITYLYKMYGWNFNILNIKITKDCLISYTSPTILGCGIFYVIFFSRVKCNNFLEKSIKFVAPSVFSIYIINSNKLICKYVVANLFAEILNYSIINILFYIIGFSIFFMSIVVLIDKFRLFLFKILKFDVLINKVSNNIYNNFNKIANRLIKSD